MFDKETNFKDLEGMTLTNIEVSDDKSEIYFTTSEGKRFIMYHDQDCCEEVLVEEIYGDLKSVLNKEIVLAEEVSKVDDNARDSGTWTFYNIATVNGFVTIRWYGESNGYYSESVSFKEKE